MTDFITTKNKKTHAELYFDKCSKKILVIGRKWNKSIFDEEVFGSFTIGELKKFIANLEKRA